jgi:hypothetical protein
MVHQEQIRGSSQDEIARLATRVNGPFHGQEKVRCALHFIQRDGTRGQQGIRITSGLIEHTDVIQGETGPRWSYQLRECRFARLSRANDDTHRHNAKRRFQVSLKPSRLMCVHGVKHIISRGESKAKDVSDVYQPRL